MKFLTELFAWWTGNTIGTRLFTWRFGTRVGEDGFGNVYFQTKDGKRRWVLYRDLSEASLVPPEWHGWLHIPSTCRRPRNPTTLSPGRSPMCRTAPAAPEAYRPPGSILNPDAGKTRQRDYEPWQPRPSVSTVAMTPPKPVQRWQADDYAVKGRFVSELARPVVDLLAPRKGERILDLGCGDGVLTEAIAAYGADVLGVDLSEELLSAARQGPQGANGRRPCASLRR